MMIAGVQVETLSRKSDQRGWLLKMLMQQELEPPREFGEIYVAVAHPGAVRGGHYHEECTEWFCVIAGRGRLSMLDRSTHERCELEMGEDHCVRVRIPPGVVHAVTNIGDGPMVLLVYADRPYNPARPDMVLHPLD